MKVMKKIDIKELGPGYFIFGNKGNVWSGTAHAYKSGFGPGTGNLCGTPALSTNHVYNEGITEVGCPECLKVLEEQKLLN
jgi:hypothetical protein